MNDLLKRLLTDEVTPELLAAELRRHDGSVSETDAESLAAVLVGFIGTVPDAIAWVIGASKDRQGGRAVAFGAGSVLVYLMDDDDLFPESTFGVLGLIDDAFLVHAFAAEVRHAYPHAGTSATYRPPTPREVAIVATLLPDGVGASLHRTAQTLVRTAGALFATPADAIDLNTSLEPTLDVSAALRVHASA